MNEITQANATTQTALGWRNVLRRRDLAPGQRR